MKTAASRKPFLLLIGAMLLLSVPYFGYAADTVTIQGRIKSLDGEPVSDAEVFLYTSNNTRKPADFISAKSDRTGSYRLVVPRTDYWAVARAKKGERYGPLLPGDRHSGEPVRVTADDEKIIELDFNVADMRELARQKDKMLQDLVEVSGRVLDPAGIGVPEVYVYARTSRIAVTIPDYISSWTDKDGRYRLLLPTGRYFLGITGKFPPPSGPQPLREFDMPAGKLPVAIDLHMQVQ
jgi:hypothetical protein